MAFADTVWFIPFESTTRTLQSAYPDDGVSPAAPDAIVDGKPFTVALEAMQLGALPHASWAQRLLHPSTDVLILTASTLGGKPLVDRVHFYQADIDLQRPLLARDLLSDVIWVCDDYKAPDALYIELTVATIDRSDEHRAAALQAFETLAGTAGAIFPVALPYAGISDGVLHALNSLWNATEPRETYRISAPIKLFPPATPRAKTIRAGQYVIVSEPIDGAECQLGDNAELTTPQGSVPTGKNGASLSYAVIRIDPVDEVPIDFVISQRVSVLLTQLKNDREGQSAGALATSLGFLTETLRGYTSFTDLQRYRELLAKGDRRTPGEDRQMRQLEQREELKPFLPQPPPPPAS